MQSSKKMSTLLQWKLLTEAINKELTMSILNILRQLFLSDYDRPVDTSSRRSRNISKNKYITVTKNGYHKRYRINKYGEVYEE